uniref:Uncharacterized protein n=1 Tax=Strongyloides venezuelensis TaxID=75913 RepID=A0A0K0G694_STRVS
MAILSFPSNNNLEVRANLSQRPIYFQDINSNYSHKEISILTVTHLLHLHHMIEDCAWIGGVMGYINHPMRY